MASCVAIADHCPEYYFNPRSKRTVAGIQACLDALGQMPCTDIAMGITPPCLLRGTGAAGSACLYSTECQSGCTDGIDRCGTCGAATEVATGETCDGTHFCASTDFCHS